MGIFTLFLNVQAQSWTNPMTLSGEWYLYGIGDPYIMKYCGTYYLYSSTKDNNIGIKCWSSNDLVHWAGPYTCSTDAVTKTAYAPEVVYWNGAFYMYTSPAGNGHYVLTGKSPTGPFTVATGNLGKSIDGSVFINDNGNWYFYHAGMNGIQGCAMSSPTAIGDDINLNTCMGNNWTEGPCVFKRNGIYYLLYTGNHCISKGYRIDYAKNSSGPINPFTAQSAQNPLLVSTEGDFVGLGHGTAFIGPDLDTYFFSYHNLAGDYGVGPYRHLNYDRIAWNGDKMLVLGPTTWAQQASAMPYMYDYFARTETGTDWTTPNGGNWIIENNDALIQTSYKESSETWHKIISTKKASDNYTAEFNLCEDSCSNSQSRTGAIFGYTDEANYGIAVIHSSSKLLEINFQVNNVWEAPRYYSLSTAFVPSAWHCLRIEKSGTLHKFFIDGMLKSSVTSTLNGGKIGYMTSWSKGRFGYIAFSNQVNGSGIFDTYKPIPGAIEAVHYISGGEGIAYHDVTVGNSGSKYIRNDSVNISDCSEGGYAITDNQTGEWYKYRVNIKATGIYNAGIRYASAGASQIRIWQDNKDLTGIVTLPSTGSNSTFSTFTVKGLNLTAGYQNLRIETIDGNYSLYRIQFQEAANDAFTQTDDFQSAFSSDWNYSDGTWAIESGEASSIGYGKRTLGSTGWTDYSLQTDITYNDVINGGLIFRVNNPALGSAGNNSQLGTDFYQGYFVTLASGALILGKQNYNYTQLASAAGSYTTNRKYTLKVVVAGANIKVYVDDLNTPKIDFTDPQPFISGKVGLRTFNAHVHFDNFQVTTGKSTPSALNTTKDSNIRIYPNPATNHLIVTGLEEVSEIRISNLEGREILKTKISPPQWTLNTSEYQRGSYILQISNKKGLSVLNKFIVL
ncbi:family 43 glycosylhydrolase [Parabacteroides sp. FAFU027]|uniref:family 43 glycosylhydrolase n=1 Tax=Parabacteroides sp. FAFU027 TaxID=2922715 RepID=UPI001FB01340|nr:family 43 glycosylhydrolase [Parabacteroides sp. FAFU027]